MINTVTKVTDVISKEQRSLISSRYKRVTQAINREFWSSDSDTAHSFYVGSYGRGTAVDTSDIDILVEIPQTEYENHNNIRGNGQSRLLQAVRGAVMSTYPKSTVRADGQVVKIDFSDGIKFEILPAFKNFSWTGIWDGTYTYADTNDGGHWKSTNPKAEQETMELKNKESNGLLYDTCKHMREIRDKHFSSYHLSGIVIDSYVYSHIGGWYWPVSGETSTTPHGTYEKKLRDESNSYFMSLNAPGSGDYVDATDSLNCLNKVLQFMAKE